MLGNFGVYPFDLKETNNALFVLLWLVLPVTNAFWDWASWWVSRGLGQHLLEIISRPDCGVLPKIWAGLWHTTLDLVLAITFLVLLAGTLPWGVGLFNASLERLGGTSPFELTEYLCAAAREPWTTGLWATLMLLSTLLPTVLHAAAALASPLAAGALWLQRDKDLARLLTAEAPGSSEFDAAVDAAAAHFAWTWIVVWIIASVLVAGIFTGLLWLGSLVTGELPKPLPGSLREALLGMALWDLEEAKTCLAVPAPAA